MRQKIKILNKRMAVLPSDMTRKKYKMEMERNLDYISALSIFLFVLIILVDCFL